MTKRVPFINRVEELSKAKAFIKKWNTQRVLCIEAEGGIGKTRLLQEIYKNALTTFPEQIQESTPTVALLHEFTETEWSRQFERGVEEMVEQLNIQLLRRDAEFDIERMAQELDEIIEEQPKVLIVRLGSHEALRPGIERAVEAGIKVLVLDNYLPRLSGISSRVTLDYSEGGLQMAEALVEDLNYEGTVAAVWVPEEAMQARRKSILDSVLLKYPDVVLIPDAFGFKGDNMVEVVADQTADFLQRHPDLQAIWVTWDEYTRGVVETLIRLERTDIAVYAFDLSPVDIELMAHSDSPWVATVATNPLEVGRTLMRLATQAAYDVDLKPHYQLPMTMIRRQDLLSTLAGQSSAALAFESLPFWSRSDIGWTSEVQMQEGRAAPREDRIVRVTDIIDFDDRHFSVSQNLWIRISEMLGEHLFELYRQKLVEYQQETSVSGYELATQERRELNEAFAACFNAVSADNRIVLFLDTTDSLDETKSIWHDLNAVLPVLRNSVFFIAGRNAGAMGSLLQETMGEAVTIYDLPPLDDQASKRYLELKQSLLRIPLEKEVADKLLFLASGHPILIDLAVEWRSRNIPLDGLRALDLEEIEALPPSERHQRQKQLQREFEEQLVSHVVETRDPLDWLILTLAHIYPLDVNFIAHLLPPYETEAQELYEEASQQVFIKTLPNGRIALHDEMRRLINTYVWPEVDLDGDRRRREARRAANYLTQELKEIRAQIQRLKQEPLTLRVEQQIDALERAFWTLELDRVRYTLESDWQEGVHTFAEVFDRAGLDVRAPLLHIVGERVEQARRRGSYDRETRYIYEIRLIKQKLRSLDLEEGRHLIESLRADYTEPRFQLDILTRMGNYYMHLGNLVEAAEQFQEALEVCEAYSEVSHWTARILDTLGLVNRRLGLLERATRYHEQALEKYQKAQVMDKAQLAAILNNICHSHALQGQYESAQSYCEESLKIREDLGVEQAIGASHSTIGELYRNRGDYERALHHYNEALRIFEPQNDPVWLARLYSFRGAVYRLLDNLEQAERDLRHSIEFNVQTEMPWEYHVLGCVLWNKNLLDEALHHFEKSMQLARAVHDVRTRFNNLVGIAEVTYTKWKASGMQDDPLRDRILRCAGELEALIEEGYDFTHHYGRMQRVLGDLAFEEQRYDDALAIYAQAYALLSRREGGYGRRTFNDELQMLARRIDYLAQDHPELSIHWCQYLREQWKNESLPILHRQRLVAMCDVREISIRRRRLG